MSFMIFEAAESSIESPVETMIATAAQRGSTPTAVGIACVPSAMMTVPVFKVRKDDGADGGGEGKH